MALLLGPYCSQQSALLRLPDRRGRDRTCRLLDTRPADPSNLYCGDFVVAGHLGYSC